MSLAITKLPPYRTRRLVIYSPYPEYTGERIVLKTDAGWRPTLRPNCELPESADSGVKVYEAASGMPFVSSKKVVQAQQSARPRRKPPPPDHTAISRSTRVTTQIGSSAGPPIQNEEGAKSGPRICEGLASVLPHNPFLSGPRPATQMHREVHSSL
jgi:hypothetical protein